MSIFNHHASVLEDYRNFVRSFFTVADDRAREFIDHELLDEARLWPEALLQVSPSYARVASVDDLASRGIILPETAQIFRNERGEPFFLYQHQVEAMDHASRRESYVVTSGTGSGKSLIYFLPIIDAFLRNPTARDRVAALVVYPMNALVNSQLEALKKLKRGYEERTGRRFPISFAKYTGDVQGDARREVQTHPPQILLTNYVMAELLLVRPDDQSLLPPAGAEGLRYFVFDELHTYRGRQGADVAMLIRRLKERSAARDVVCVGTSATMVASREATPLQRRETVAAFASQVFGRSIKEDQVIEETLEPFTLGGAPSRQELTAALTAPLPAALPEFRRHPLARWSEGEFGVEPEADGRLRRRVPRTLTDPDTYFAGLGQHFHQHYAKLFAAQYVCLLQKAIALAAAAHYWQKRKQGSPYVPHPLRMACPLKTEAEQIVAVLHDVVEDTHWTFGRPQTRRFSRGNPPGPRLCHGTRRRVVRQFSRPCRFQSHRPPGEIGRPRRQYECPRFATGDAEARSTAHQVYHGVASPQRNLIKTRV